MLIMLGVFGLIFYFLLYCLQVKCVKEYKVLVFLLGKGDEVLIQGGLVGCVIKVFDEKDFIEIVLNDVMNIVV